MFTVPRRLLRDVTYLWDESLATFRGSMFLLSRDKATWLWTSRDCPFVRDFLLLKIFISLFFFWFDNVLKRYFEDEYILYIYIYESFTVTTNSWGPKPWLQQTPKGRRRVDINYFSAVAHRTCFLLSFTTVWSFINSGNKRTETLITWVMLKGQSRGRFTLSTNHICKEKVGDLRRPYSVLCLDKEFHSYKRRKPHLILVSREKTI